MSRSSRYLLDTNVISEISKPRRNQQVEEFFRETDLQDLFVSVMTIGELRKGLEITRRKDRTAGRRLTRWIEQIEVSFEDRILAVDLLIANQWSSFSADRSRPVVDTLLAATAYVHGLTLATRNTIDFEELPIALLNPWIP